MQKRFMFGGTLLAASLVALPVSAQQAPPSHMIADEYVNYVHTSAFISDCDKKGWRTDLCEGFLKLNGRKIMAANAIREARQAKDKTKAALCETAADGIDCAADVSVKIEEATKKALDQYLERRRQQKGD